MQDEQRYLEHLEGLEESVEMWEDYLSAFSKTFYPACAQYGMSFGESLIVYKLNQNYNQLITLEKIFTEEAL